MRKTLKKFWQPMPVAILSFSISLTAGAFVMQSSIAMAHEAKNRAAAVQEISAAQVVALQSLTEAQDQKQREILCGYFEKATLASTVTDEAKGRLRVTIAQLGCTPDLNDNK